MHNTTATTPLITSSLFVPQLFHLQWHITERCNLRCTHCYQTSYDRQESSFQELTDILTQYKQSIIVMRAISGKNIQGHITLTGGEPLVYEHFFALLELFTKDSAYYDFSLLTNGTLITKEIAKKIKKYHPKYVQISIEGTQTTHDSIRGTGMYEKAIQGLKQLIAQNIYTVVSFTAHKKNYHEFTDVVSVCDQIGVRRVWSDRLIPSGSGDGMKEYLFTPEDTQHFFQLMATGKKQLEEKSSKTHVAMHRALQFLEGGTPYICQAGKTLITIDVNGDVYPCRRMPIKAGNVHKSHLFDIYYQSDIMNALRNEENTPDSCKKCPSYNKCHSGLRCLTYATTNTPFEKDPGCWIKT